MNETTTTTAARKEFRIIFCSFLDVACNFSSRFGREKSRAERTWDDLKGIFFKSISLEWCAMRHKQMNMFLLVVGGLYT